MQLTSAAAQLGYFQARNAAAPDPGAQAGSGSLLAKAADEFTAIMDQGESSAVSSMLGQGDPHQLVQALTKSELAIETAVMLRDRVVEAYQEIMRMPV